jgi:hypothetical protein
MMVKYVSAPDFDGLPAPESDFTEEEQANLVYKAEQETPLT